MKSQRTQRLLQVLVVSIVFTVFTCQYALAERWHVQTTGTRTTGSSVADDWTPENCYPTLVEASTLAAAGDTILLFNERHLIAETAILPALLANMVLGNEPNMATLECGPAAQLTLGSGGGDVEVRGVTITGDGSASDLAVFLINTGGGTLASATFDACLFTGNTGSSEIGGNSSCIDASSSGGGATLAITNCSFEGNVSRGIGGAMTIGNDFLVSLENSEFIANEAQSLLLGAVGQGGAIAVFSPLLPSTLTISDCLFSGNKSTGPGGALFSEDASVSLLRTDFTGNLSAFGAETNWSAGAGAMIRRQKNHIEELTVTVEMCTLTDNKGDLTVDPWAGAGGGLMVRRDTDRPMSVTVTDSEFRGNYNAQGGGLHVGRYATGTVQRCRFHDNTAFLQGGASFKGGQYPDNIGETVVYEYCEFAGNQAGLDDQGGESTILGYGGAFCTRLATRGEFYNCTFVNNVANGPLHLGDAIMHPNEGGVFDDDNLRCVIVNSVFYGTVGNDIQVRGRTDAFSQVSNNAWEAGQFDSPGVVPVNTVEISAIPFFSLVDLRLAPESPLIDAALDIGMFLDIDLNAVFNGAGPDIGAYESDFGVVPVFDVPAVETVLSIWPNPFNPRTTLSYELAGDRFVAIEIFDIQGRRVSVLESGYQAAGLHQVVWNGVDDRGRALPSGVYNAILRLGNENFAQKMTLIR